jgi:hypothetical protein
MPLTILTIISLVRNFGSIRVFLFSIIRVLKLIILKLFMYLLLIFLPFIGSFCAGLFGRKLGPYGASYITVSCMAFAFLISLFVFYEVALLNCCVYLKLTP